MGEAAFIDVICECPKFHTTAIKMEIGDYDDARNRGLLIYSTFCTVPEGYETASAALEYRLVRKSSQPNPAVA